MAAPDNLGNGSGNGSGPGRISPARLALAVKRARADREGMDLIASDPIAIVGMACRFPGGGDSPEEFWKALQEGRDCVGPISAGRWKDAGTLSFPLLEGGYLEEIEGFDAAFFGIAPREAQHMDPQQRLLLEVVWEALWDAGIEPAGVTGTDAGVFAAIYNNDYARLHFQDTACLSAHGGIGAAHSVAAGRLSFLLNLKGPCLALDSACSSSLVATHLACQSLRTQECGLAIVAASSLKLLSDEVQMFSKWGMLAADGKCKTFDAGADGFVPGEGGGAVILKRLSDALQDGDRIRAVIRGTAVNHDGRTTVLTAPNGLAQETVLRAALKNAMIEPQEVGYIETHGTGTALGDPIEVEAIGNVYGREAGGSDTAGSDAANGWPCVLGAVKTNLGHLEAAAGIAGLMKTVLCLENEEIPRNLHFQHLNPEISLAGTRLVLATDNRPWRRGAAPRVAGISSFGLGGTNGHLIVEEAPVLPAGRSNQSGRPIPLPARRWQRQRFWLPEPSSETKKISANFLGTDAGHPLLGQRIDSAFVQGALFASDLNTEKFPYLAEHRLGDRAIVPFAAFLEAARAGLRESGNSGSAVLCNFTMREPLFVGAESTSLQVHVGSGVGGEAGSESVEIASKQGSQWTVHAKGSNKVRNAKTENIDIAILQARIRVEALPGDIYRLLEQTGLSYGAAFRVIESAWSGEGESLVHLRLPVALRKDASSYGLHPVLLDGCLQAVLVARKDMGSDLFLPISVDVFELTNSGATEIWVHTKLTHESMETISADIEMADASGRIVGCLVGFTAKRTDARSLVMPMSQSHDLQYEPTWRIAPPLPAGTSRRKNEQWLLIENRSGSCRSLANALTQRGAACTVVDVAEVFGALTGKISWTGVVYDTRGGKRPADGLEWESPEQPDVEFVLQFVKALRNANGPSPRLCIVTSSAVAVLPAEDVAVEQAPLRGIARTLALEHPETSPVLIDVGPHESLTRDVVAHTNTMLEAEIDGGEDPLVAFRNGNRYVARLIQPDAEIEGNPRKLQMGTSGRLEDLRIETTGRNAPDANQVEICVRAAGLNFRDVLTALGMLSARASVPGAECAGTIVRVGLDVRGLLVGDEVAAFAPGSLQTFVNVAADFVVAKPPQMTFADAASIPIAFLTAEYGLMKLAKLSAGQSILIHAAAGGLGLATVQLAMRAGAKVFATAGSAEKREFLKRLGVEHVFDSRSLAFRDQLLQATGGCGVDVVLNSLAGEFIRASFDTVAAGGCFLEVGKRGIWSGEQVAALGKNIRYFPFDLGDVAAANPGLIGKMLRSLMQRFSAQELQPLPTTLYEFDEATDAFRTMAQARHVGKIVLGIEDKAIPVNLRELVSDGTVLITGGLGALGMETARWLAAHGARRIVLATRHSQSDHPIFEELRAQGVEAVAEYADVADSRDVEAVLDRIRATKFPLRAVFHAAGIVEDSVLANESLDSYKKATAAKIAGGWNLHRLTKSDPVRLMVFFSSAASFLGAQGQGSYAAGNAFLDALAHHRASRGLRSLSVNWGAWASAGMAVRLSPEQTARWTRQGAMPMDPAAALTALQKAIESGRTQVAVLNLDWEKFLGGSKRQDAVIFAELRQKIQRSERPENNSQKIDAQENILEQIESATGTGRKSILATHVKQCARAVLGQEPSTVIDDSIPLQEIGLDSLMALEMRNELAQSLHLSLAAGLLFDYPSVAQLSEHLLQMLDLPQPNIDAADSVDRLSMAALKSLSDEEAERLLIEELDRIEEQDRAEGEKTHA